MSSLQSMSLRKTSRTKEEFNLEFNFTGGGYLAGSLTAHELVQLE